MTGLNVYLARIGFDPGGSCPPWPCVRFTPHPIYRPLTPPPLFSVEQTETELPLLVRLLPYPRAAADVRPSCRLRVLFFSPRVEMRARVEARVCVFFFHVQVCVMAYACLRPRTGCKRGKWEGEECMGRGRGGCWCTCCHRAVIFPSQNLAE